MERECRQQKLIDAPVKVVWDLVGDPNRHPEWWPTTVDTECEQIERGCRYRAVVTSPTGRGGAEHHVFTIERLDDCHEVLIRCEDMGSYTHFLLTEAQGRTFLDARFGIEATSLGMSALVAVSGRRILRRWLEETVRSLEQAASGPLVADESPQA
jgi:uncharacterized protein YndB with AHSA1/START domain